MLNRTETGGVVRGCVPPWREMGGELARLAGQLCTSARFQRWLAERAGPCPHGVAPQDWAAEYVRRACGVTSRRELDHSSRAAALFHERIRRPFVRWSAAHV